MPFGSGPYGGGAAPGGLGTGGRGFGSRSGVGNENSAAGKRSAVSRGSTYGGSMGRSALGGGGLSGFLGNMLDRTITSYTQPMPDYNSLGLFGKALSAFGGGVIGPAMGLTSALQAMGIPNTPINRTGGMPDPAGGPTVNPGPERGGSGSGGPGNNPIQGILTRAFTPMQSPLTQPVDPGQTAQGPRQGPVIDTFNMPGRTTYSAFRRRFAGRGFGNGGLG